MKFAGAWLSRNWIVPVLVILGIWVTLPFIAPVFMAMGWTTVGRGLYGLYTIFCHQLPQRSFFLFGPQVMYSLPEIQSAWGESLDPMVLRQFIGNAEMGWKVAWSDRMVSMYTSIPLFAALWWVVRRVTNGKRPKPLPLWAFLLTLVPMGVDGISHFISDLFGIGQGFRDSNVWLAALTNSTLPPHFYAGDALGSFNSWMRLITGLLFGYGIVWFGFPYLDDAFRVFRPVKDKSPILETYMQGQRHPGSGGIEIAREQRD